MQRIDLQRRQILKEKLLLEGFVKKKEGYQSSFPTMNGKFQLDIQIGKEEVTFRVVDPATQEEFLLHEKHQGPFLDALNKEIDSVLDEILKRCTLEAAFIEENTLRLINFVQKEFDLNLEFLWKNEAHLAVWRNVENRKWFGLLALLPEKKLDSGRSDQKTEVLVCKCEPDKIPALLKNKGFYPAWHMNKKNWISIVLKEVDFLLVSELITEAYSLIKSKPK